MRLHREDSVVTLPAHPALGRPQQVPADKKPVSKKLLETPACEKGLEKACRHHDSHVMF